METNELLSQYMYQSQMISMLFNFIYACIGSFAAIIFMYLGYKILDTLTLFKTSKKLEEGNIAVGLFTLGVFLAIGISTGLTFGMALN